ncbi:unnamed protein product [Caenorhabditis bovis]|uniref:Leucine-rich repeat-containing protein 59 n=1 Tax=Caenorhabditis bovis TaxID=2654633 RepID=A0A8S1EKX6_9PELO|nr:unnamed protein product [Caenorhabditis bovis]
MSQNLSLQELKNLQEDEEIDLSARQLVDVPPALVKLSKISHVDLSTNKIVCLPSAICKMTRIIKLDLANNRLYNLPSEIGNLRNLQYLNLYNNEIEDLPLGFADLKSLKWLDLKKNPLTEKLAKAAGNCGNENECKAAALSVVRFVGDRKKDIEALKSVERKVHEKIQLMNLEEKKRNRVENQQRKLREAAQGNAKSNGAAAHTSHNKDARLSAATMTKAKKASPAKKADDVDGVATKKRRGVFGYAFNLMYYVTVAVLAAATVAILINCADGAKNIPGSAPLCRDLTRIAAFEKPSALFWQNTKKTYGTVLYGYKRQLEPYTSKITKTTSQYYRKFAKTDIGAKIERLAIRIHTWFVDNVAKVVIKQVNTVQVWYKKEGHKHFQWLIDAVVTGSKMLVEMTLDILRNIANALAYVFTRIEIFVSKLMESGFQAAIKTLQ